MKKVLFVLALGAAFVACKSGENTEVAADTNVVAPAPDTTATQPDTTAAGTDTTAVTPAH